MIERDDLPEIFYAGYSTGGNLVLKMAGELAEQAPQELRGICAVCPCVDLATCADGSGQARNLVYEAHFLRSMRTTLRRKAEFFPERYRTERVSSLRTLREWDEAFTAPEWGYRDAADYYQRGSAARVMGQISVPTLIIAAEDDPLVPIASLRRRAIEQNPAITLLTSRYGGHCAFISRNGGPERFWAESRAVEFCREHSVLISEERRS